jgi:hypothetical protein
MNSENSKSNNNYEEDEVTFKEIILKFHEYANEVKNSWFLLLFIIIPFLVFFLYKHFTQIPTYTAETKFFIEGNNNTSGGLGGLLGQFGIRSGGGKFNPSKISEVAKSKPFYRQILFEKYNDDFIANQIINKYGLLQNWVEIDPLYQNFKFKNTDFSKFDTLEKRAFLNIINLITGGPKAKNPLVSFEYDDGTGVYKYVTTTQNEALSIYINNLAYNKLKFFFEEELMANQVSSMYVLKSKADSIQRLIIKKTYQTASVSDRSLGLVRATPMAGKAILDKEIQGLTMAYTEIMKNYELSDINTRDTKPMFIKLDESMSPLDPKNSSLITSILKAILFGGLIGVSFIIFRKIYKNAMA